MADWDARKGPMDAVFKAIDADILGFQEIESFSRGSAETVNLARDWLLDQNPDYRAAAMGPWRTFPSTQPIFYRHDALDLEDQGWFFFSDTPDVIYSRTFNGSFPAFASWATFRLKANGAQLHVMNVHLDYASRENRRRSTELIATRLMPWMEAGDDVVLMGDFNALFGSALHRRLEETGLAFAQARGASFHLNRGLHLFGAIDHIALSPDLRATGQAWVFREKLGERWASDHYPVGLDITHPQPRE